MMFGLVPFFDHNVAKHEDSPVTDLFNVFDEPFFQGFHTPTFKVDVKENADSYDLSAELPGLKKENISLTYDNHHLTIATKNEKSEDQKDDQGNFVRRERSQSSMSRSFYIDGIDESKCTASYADGILSVHMPKLAPAEPQGHEIHIG